MTDLIYYSLDNVKAMANFSDEDKNVIFQVEMKRRRTPVLLQVYLPSGLFVIVSWISFIVPPEVVPGETNRDFSSNGRKSWMQNCFKIFYSYSCILLSLLAIATLET